MSLSPWGMYGDVWTDLASPMPPRQFRPRRPSYVLATQLTRQRNESYRSATSSTERPQLLSSSSDGGGRDSRGVRAIAFDVHGDYIDQNDLTVGRSSLVDVDWLQVDASPERRESRIEFSPATGNELTRTLSSSNHVGHNNRSHLPPTSDSPPSIWCETTDDIVGSSRGSFAELNRLHSAETVVVSGRLRSTDDQRQSTADAGASSLTGVWRRRKNLCALSVGFLLVFTAFRTIQSLESKVNSAGRLGTIAMAIVHGTMAAVCPFLAPIIASGFPPAKWTIVLSAVLYVIWISANLCPHPLTLLPAALAAGVAQCIAWAAQIAYMRAIHADQRRKSTVAQSSTDPLASGDSRRSVSRPSGGRAAVRRRREKSSCCSGGLFVACFQTSHIWGNLISSLMLAGGLKTTSIDDDDLEFLDNETAVGMEEASVSCGVYDRCSMQTGSAVWSFSNPVKAATNPLLKLMVCYLTLSVIGLLLLLVFVDNIATKTDKVDKPRLETVRDNVSRLYKQTSFKYLVPLLVFNGFEQGFIYSDYTKSYIACTLGVEYIGYNMITFGVANFLFSIAVGSVVRRIVPEALIGIANKSTRVPVSASEPHSAQPQASNSSNTRSL